MNEEIRIAKENGYIDENNNWIPPHKRAKEILKGDVK
jgi:hypothetical protein